MLWIASFVMSRWTWTTSDTLTGELEDCIAHNFYFFERDERGDRQQAATYDEAEDTLAFEHARRNKPITKQ